MLLQGRKGPSLWLYVVVLVRWFVEVSKVDIGDRRRVGRRRGGGRGAAERMQLKANRAAARWLSTCGWSVAGRARAERGRT
jgi:hypothetical protein